MRQRLRHPSTAFTLLTAGTVIILMAAANIMSTIFWHFAGGVGELDLDGGANLFSPGAAIRLPPPGTAERLIAITDAYPASAIRLHVWLTCSLDLVFPPAVALLAWTALRWCANRVARRRLRTAMTVTGAALGTGYLLADWTENVLELRLLSGLHGTAGFKPQISAIKMGASGLILLAILTSLVASRVWRAPARARGACGPAVAADGDR